MEHRPLTRARADTLLSDAESSLALRGLPREEIDNQIAELSEELSEAICNESPETEAARVLGGGDSVRTWTSAVAREFYRAIFGSGYPRGVMLWIAALLYWLLGVVLIEHMLRGSLQVSFGVREAVLVTAGAVMTMTVKSAAPRLAFRHLYRGIWTPYDYLILAGGMLLGLITLVAELEFGFFAAEIMSWSWQYTGVVFVASGAMVVYEILIDKTSVRRRSPETAEMFARTTEKVEEPSLPAEVDREIRELYARKRARPRAFVWLVGVVISAASWASGIWWAVDPTVKLISQSVGAMGLMFWAVATIIILELVGIKRLWQLLRPRLSVNR